MFSGSEKTSVQEGEYLMVKLGCLEPDGYVNLRHRDLMAGVTVLLFSILAALWNWMWGSPLRRKFAS